MEPMRPSATPRPTSRDAPPPDRDPTPSSAAHRATYGRALRVGLAISILLHLLALLFVSRTQLVWRAVPASAPIAVAGDPSVMRVERIIPVPDAGPEPARPDEPVEEEEQPEPVEAEPRAPGAAGPTEGAPTDAARVAPSEMLRPRMGDPRLWTRVEPPPVPEPSEFEQVQIRIAARLGAWNDSIASEAERARAATDWTVSDEDGGKWGISPGKIHLGDITIPLPFGVSLGSPWKHGEAAERERRDDEIRAQAAREEAKQRAEERVREIRERMERERNNKKAGSGKGGSSGSPPDTTGTAAGTGPPG